MFNKFLFWSGMWDNMIMFLIDLLYKQKFLLELIMLESKSGFFSFYELILIYCVQKVFTGI